MSTVPLVPEKKPVLLTGPAGTLDHLTAVRAIGKLMDSIVTIPGTNIRVGADAILGFVPVVGDAISGVIGTYIVFVAAKMGVSKPVLTQMLLNLGADTVAGSVPVVGDVLDVAWRANVKNVRLLEQALAEPKARSRQSWLTIVGLGAAVLAMTAGGIALTVWLAKLVWTATGG